MKLTKQHLIDAQKILETEFDTKAYLKYISSEEYLQDKKREASENIAAYLENSHEGIAVTFKDDNFSFSGEESEIMKAIEVLNTIRGEE